MGADYFLARSLSRVVLVSLLLVTGAATGRALRGISHSGWRYESCDVSLGSWVVDPGYPLYGAESCPFIENEFDCLGHGRPDHDYLRYRWQPSGCNLSR
ncbi:hypothetical protein MLD38_033292 [Melastoma candidum]|nr:hypothetical protein MLD38_033292 [Melastoma candidum]